MMDFEPFPKQEEFINAVISRKYLEILYGGAMGGGKTIAEVACCIILCKLYPKSKYVICRKDKPTIERNLYPSWDEICPTNFIQEDKRKSLTNPRVIFKNGSEALFYPENYEKDKDSNRLRGFNVNGFFCDELNELAQETYNMMKSRIGRNIVPSNPPKFIAGTCNPTRGWLKTTFYDLWKENRLPPYMLYIPSKMHDNPYVKHLIEDQRKMMSKYSFDVFVNGNWDIQLKIGNEYWRSFELNDHVRITPYDPFLPIHISIDNNVLPYIAITVWQVHEDEDFKDIRQIHELTVRDPDNTAIGAAKKVISYLESIEYNEILFLYGDASAKAKNTIDPQKRSFVDLFQKEIETKYTVRNLIPSSNPSIAIKGVSIRGEFINCIYEGVIPNAWITIDENCKESIGDYIEVKQDANGGMLKKKITKNGLSYEEFGHLSDTKAYFLCKLLNEEFNKFKNKNNASYSMIKSTYKPKL